MRVVVQRVSEASVTINNSVKSSIGAGLLVLVGVEDADTFEDIDWLIRKITNLRIFDDEQGVMNRSVKDIDGNILVVSQFTLFASTKKGNRPSYIRSAGHDRAIPIYREFCWQMGLQLGKKVETGEFGAEMQVRLINEGPVTICIDTKNKE